MDVGIVGLLNLSCLGGLLYLGNNIIKESSALNEFDKAKLFSPNRLIQYFQRKNSEATTKRSDENPDERIIRGFVEGYVDCKNPITSKIDRKTKLIYGLYFKDDIYSNDSFNRARNARDYTNKNNEVDAPLYFALKDP